MDVELAALLEKVKRLPPETPEQRFEGRVSMIYGLLGDERYTLVQIRDWLIKHEGHKS